MAWARGATAPAPPPAQHELSPGALAPPRPACRAMPQFKRSALPLAGSPLPQPAGRSSAAPQPRRTLKRTLGLAASSASSSSSSSSSAPLPPSSSAMSAAKPAAPPPPPPFFFSFFPLALAAGGAASSSSSSSLPAAAGSRPTLGSSSSLHGRDRQAGRGGAGASKALPAGQQEGTA